MLVLDLSAPRESRQVTVVQLPTRFTIGGSEAAAAAGIDPHRSRVGLWLEKTGRVEREETEAMRA